MIEPTPMAESMPRWAPHFPQFDTVVGNSDLGHVFVANQTTGEYGVLYPYDAAGKNYGQFAGTAEFVDTIVRDQYFSSVILLSGHVAEIKNILGPLEAEQVYIATPYPFLGGTEEPDTYQIGDLWVFLDIVGQFQLAGEDAPKRRWWSRRR
ncbi:T6SS immunity protein Tdi1 domain-containing protein [Nocardia sp. NPDC048505]|uniref:T6SS immunity protein Tdi1 domain-containing protein n=1 Tax=unclassified Nocardia TaxID=2637762 RepID=UPI0033D7DE1E